MDAHQKRQTHINYKDVPYEQKGTQLTHQGKNIVESGM